MSRTEADIETFINDLDTDEVAALVNLVSGLDPLAEKDGKPAYGVHELNLIQLFQQFTASYPEGEDSEVEVDEDGLEKEDVEAEEGENPDEDGDIPGTGETEEEYVARLKAENEGDGNAHNGNSDDVSDLVKHDFEAGIPGATRIQ